MPSPEKMIFPVTWMGYLGLHEFILYIVIVLLVVALGGGPAIKTLFNAILKIFGHGSTETIVNIEQSEGIVSRIPKECEKCGLVVDPTKCIMHQAESDRSKRNERQIENLWLEYGKLRNENLATANKLKDEMVAGFKEVAANIAESNKMILGALAGNSVGYEKPGRGGSE